MVRACQCNQMRVIIGEEESIGESSTQIIPPFGKYFTAV